MIAVISDTLIAAAIVAAFVLAVVVLLRRYDQAEKREAEALAARLKCPDCGTRSLFWAGKVWVIHTTYDDGDEWASGLTFRCGECRKEFEFTRDGVRFNVGWKDRKSEE